MGVGSFVSYFILFNYVSYSAAADSRQQTRVNLSISCSDTDIYSCSLLPSTHSFSPLAFITYRIHRSYTYTHNYTCTIRRNKSNKKGHNLVTINSNLDLIKAIIEYSIVKNTNFKFTWMEITTQ